MFGVRGFWTFGVRTFGVHFWTFGVFLNQLWFLDVRGFGRSGFNILTLLKNIDIDIDMVIFENIDIDIDKAILENIDIEIDIDKAILKISISISIGSL